MTYASKSVAVPSRAPLIGALALAASLAMPGAAAAQSLTLPGASPRPLVVDTAADPILKLGQDGAGDPRFRETVLTAIARHPALAEVQAQLEEAKAAKREARAALLPSAEYSVSAYQIIDRSFRNSLDNIIQRSVLERRTDLTGQVSQLLWDFGATSYRIGAAGDRLRAASASIDGTADEIALRTIAAWYDIFAGRTLLGLAEAYRQSVVDNRDSVKQRIDQGASAASDIARVDTAIASLDTRLARYRRELANAEARYQELTGAPPPPNMTRGPTLGVVPAGVEAARDAAANIPTVTIARAQSEAARREAKALRADTLPQLSASVEGGRYGAFEVTRDYDVRARLTLRQRLFGGIYERAEQGESRADAARARADRVREEAGRDAATAYTDLMAVEAELASLASAYVASRQTRDALTTRFLAARGSLLDVLAANDTYFGTAAAYIQAIAGRDAARYVLLSRTGRLLTALEIPSAAEERPLP